MSNKRAILAFVIGVLAVLSAMAWVTSHTLRLERAEVEARAEAQRQEVIRLVLWRMDSALTPIIAREAARPYFEYQAFYSAAPTINPAQSQPAGEDVLVPSPLISPSEPFVHLYFQSSPGGELTSPQVPTGIYENLAELSYVTSYSIAAARERLNTLSQLISKQPYPAHFQDLALSDVWPHSRSGTVDNSNSFDLTTRQDAHTRTDVRNQQLPGMPGEVAKDIKESSEQVANRSTSDSSGTTGQRSVPRHSDGAATVSKPAGVSALRSSEAPAVSTLSPATPPPSAIIPPATSSPARESQPQTFQTSPATQQTISEYQARQLATSAANTLTEKRSKAQSALRQPPVSQSQQNEVLSSGSPEDVSARMNQFESKPSEIESAASNELKKESFQTEPAYSTFPVLSGGGITRWQSTWQENSSQALVSIYNYTLSFTKQQDVEPRKLASEVQPKGSLGRPDAPQADAINQAVASVSAPRTPPPLPPPLSSSAPPPAASSKSGSVPSFLTPRIESQAPTFTQSPFVARWIEPSPGASPELLFERIVQIAPVSDALTSSEVANPQATTTYIQGIWLDWPSLKSLLLSTSVDLLPTVELTPVYDMSIIQSDQSLLGRLLASIPAQLVLPPVPQVTLSGWTPIRTTLGVMWAVVLVAICIAAVVLAVSIELAQRRGRFVSAVTHELRTPITTFCMYSQMLADGMIPDGEAKQGYFQTLKGESHRLARIVESVLDYARLSGRKSPVHNTTLPITQLLADSVPPLSTRCSISQMNLIVNAPALDDPLMRRTITTDRERLDRILYNLIENACKYAAESATRNVILHVAVRPQALELSVVDDGPGVDPHEVRRIFKPFTRGDSHAHGTIPGLGLGLAISQGLAQELGGTLELAPRRSGEGARFVLTIPLR